MGALLVESKSQPSHRPPDVVQSYQQETADATVHRIASIRADRFRAREDAQQREKRRLKEAREARHDRIVALKADRREERTINSSSKVSLSGIAGCIAEYESGGDPRAENPTTTASGLYQFVDGTWNGYGGYYHAADAPVSVQTERFYQVWDGGNGASQWVVAHNCGY
jgi:hypothetical protein